MLCYLLCYVLRVVLRYMPYVVLCYVLSAVMFHLTGSPKIAINDFQVSQVTSAKSLGVIIDDKLVWSSHIEKLTKKIAVGIGAIKRVRHLVPQATLHLICRALIQPHFD